MALLDNKPRDGGEVSPDALIPEARELQRRRMRRTGAALLGALILAGGVFALFGGGGTPGVPTLHGPLPAGIAARTADPTGRLAWGLRVVHTTGWTCVQVGRLSGDQLGLIGKDGAFHDDGRFHPFRPSTTNQARCAPNDGDGHAFMTIEHGGEPASGSGGGYQGYSQCQPAAEIARFRSILPHNGRAATRRARLQLSQACPSGDLRFVQYGLLGPDATSITYTLGNGPVVERTQGEDGAYLVVGPATSTFCAELAAHGICGSQDTAPNSIFGGMILAVHYRNGRTCQPGATAQRLPLFARRCPPVGYVPAKPAIRRAQVATPISFQLVPAARYCLTPSTGPRSGFGSAAATDLGGYVPCTRSLLTRDQHAGYVERGTLVVFSWTAREPVTSRNTEYEYMIDCNSYGQGNSTYGRIHAGERITRGIVIQPSCKGTVTGTIGYEPNLGPGGGDFAGGNPGHDGSLLVGGFHFAVH